MIYFNGKELLTNKNYVIDTSKQLFYSAVENTNKKTYVFSVFEERIRALKQQLKNSLIEVTTPKKVAETECYLILDDPDYLVPFGYADIIESLCKQNCFVALSSQSPTFIQDPIKIVRSLQCAVKCEENKKFAVLFAVIKFGLFDTVTVVVDNDPEKRRVSLFLKVFGYKNWKRVVKSNEMEKVVGCAVVFMDRKVDCKSAMYLTTKEIEGVKNAKFDFERVTEFEYKIADVLKALTKNVCNGRKNFEGARFKGLEGLLSRCG